LILLAIIVALLAVATVRAVSLTTSDASRSSAPGPAPTNAIQAVTRHLPPGVTLRQIDGGPHYYARINSASAWMDRHILLGGWDEQPLTTQDVRYDVAMGNNIYWGLAGNPLDTVDCGAPCRVNFNVIRDNGMHASAPDTTSKSGSETVAHEGTDEADLNYGPGWGRWNGTSCIPANSYACGWTVARYFYTGRPSTPGLLHYPIDHMPITQGYGAQVDFWETDQQAENFLRYSDTESADLYWMTDPDLNLPSQGGCALLPESRAACGGGDGRGLTDAQRVLPANYAFNVTRLEDIRAATSNPQRPVTVDVETGCPGSHSAPLCTTPPAMQAAAWHALIAGARGIIWFQHNFAGPCVTDRSFMDGSYPTSPLYNCQQKPGVTMHDVVLAVSTFNHEVAGLNSALLSPFAENYVSIGGADVSTMAKYSHGTFYVFAASGKPAMPPANNQSVTFNLAGRYTGPVTVVDENRTLRAVKGVFTDTFVNEDSVHVYEIGRCRCRVQR
jgi:hypothetical protein